MESTIFHIDVNSAFLSWEAVYCLTYKGEREDFPYIFIKSVFFPGKSRAIILFLVIKKRGKKGLSGIFYKKRGDFRQRFG